MSFNSNNRRSLNCNSKHSNREYFKDNLRVLRKNLLFCSGLPLYLTETDIRSERYFGKYGKVSKVILLKSLRQMSAYVTYSDNIEASLAVLATNDFELDRHHKLASIFGTIKYCKYFLKKIQCKNMPNCNYLHVLDRKNEIYIDNQLPDEVFEEHEQIALDTLENLDMHKVIQQKRWRPNNPDLEDQNIMPCPIEAIQRIFKQTYPQYRPKQQDEASEISRKQQTCQRNSTQTTARSSEEEKCKDKYKEKSIVDHNKAADHNKIAVTSQNKPEQSLQIRLIRKLVRQPCSKLGNWTEPNLQQSENEVDLFHVGLSQLNELKANCQHNILKQINREQERLKFLLIKNIHHKNDKTVRNQTKPTANAPTKSKYQVA